MNSIGVNTATSNSQRNLVGSQVSETERTYAQINDLITSAHSRLSDLTASLRPVLKPEIPVNPKVCEPIPSSTPRHEMLQAHVSGLELLCTALSALNDRIEA